MRLTIQFLGVTLLHIEADDGIAAEAVEQGYVVTADAMPTFGFANPNTDPLEGSRYDA